MGIVRGAGHTVGITMSREVWLQTAIAHLRRAISAIGLTLPEIIHVSVGFPSTNALRGRNQRIGECWASKCSADGNPQVYISPLIADGSRVLDILLHELIHAAGIDGHRANFGKPAVKLGLTGKMTQTVATPDLKQRLNRLIDTVLGPYPHQLLSPSESGRKKQSARMLKAVCDECEAVIRMSKKVAEDPGMPTCACGGQFELELGGD